MNDIDLKVLLAGISAVFPEARVTLVRDHTGYDRARSVRVESANYGVQHRIEPWHHAVHLAHEIVDRLAHGISERAMRVVYK